MEHFTVPPGMGGSSRKNSSRNMTGIFLGNDGKSSPPQGGGSGGQQARQTIPPLARGRGIRVKTPVEHQRYKKVEMFRAREESRGFPAKPIKRTKYSLRTRQTEETSYTGRPVSPSQFRNITRKTWRNYTQILNNGMQRLEYLNLDVNNPHQIHAEPGLVRHHSSAPEEPVPEENLYDEIRRVVSLSEHQGNQQVLQGLLPQRRAHTTPHSTRRPKFLTTPLTIKSLRNPDRPTEIVQFAEVDRPRSTPNPRPLLPTPYFYSVTNKAKVRSSLGPRKLGQPEEKRSMIPVFLGPETFRQSSASSSLPHDDPGALQGTNKWIPGLGPGPASTSLASANNGGSSFLARHMGRRGSGGILDGRKTNTPVSQLLEGPDPHADTAAAVHDSGQAAMTEDVVVSLPTAVQEEGREMPPDGAGQAEGIGNTPAKTGSDNGKQNTNSEHVLNGDVGTPADRAIPIHDNWESAVHVDNHGQDDVGMDGRKEEESSSPDLNVIIDIHVETAPEEDKEPADDTPLHMDPGFSATQMAEREAGVGCRRARLARLLEEHAQLVQKISQAEESVGSK